MGFQRDARVEAEHRISRVPGSSRAFAIGVCTAIAVGPALAASDINAGSTYLASGLGSSVNPTFNGGTLQLDTATTITQSFTLKDVPTNTIDIDGHAVTMSGAFTGTGPIIITNSASGGSLTWTSSGNTYTGATTINSGASLVLSGSGTMSASSKVTVNGALDISAASGSVNIISLAGNGSVALGTQSLTITGAASDTFSGVISGSGSLYVATGTMTLSGANTFTGVTSQTSGTLILANATTLSSSGNVLIYGTLDAKADGATLKSLGGSGSLLLGSKTLTLTAANNTFSGSITGTAGSSIVLAGGTQYLSGTVTGISGITVNDGATLDLGSATVAYDITTSNSASNAGKVDFFTTSTVDVNGQITGAGSVRSMSTGITTFHTAQSYTGTTTITLGTIRLQDTGSIASSSGVTVNSAFDISGISAAGTSITTLGGSGVVSLGSKDLTITSGSTSYTFSGQITGGGHLIVAGGTQVLSGTNLYTGSTTINSGATLQLQTGSSLRSAVIDTGTLDVSVGTSATHAATIADLTGNGTVTLGSNTLVLSNANAAGSFDGTLTGSGGLSITGGSATLKGVSTYTGTTTVASGTTLTLASGAGLAQTSKLAINGTFDVSQTTAGSITFASLSGSGTVGLGANRLVIGNAAGTFSGVINGSNGLTVGGGTLILSGTNAYTGGTTINSGATLQLGAGITSGSILGDVTDNGTLVFNRAGTSVFAGQITGGGALVQNGSGTTILTGSNHYTGGTQVNYGTLQIGNGGTSGSIDGPVTVNIGTLAFARSDAITINAAVSGNGNVSFLNGTTTFTVAQAYTGSTTIASGATFALSGSGSVASSRIVADNGTFDVSAVSAPAIVSLSGSGHVALGSQTLTITNSTTEFSGVLEGSGGLTIGGGTEVLSGTSTYTGATTLNGGTLAVTGNIATSSGVMVNTGGTLAGTGTVSALTVNSGGTVAPTGNLTVAGNAIFASGGHYVVNTSAASYSALTVNGSATLAGTLSLVSADGSYYLGRPMTVLTATGGITGNFTLPSTITNSQGAVFLVTSNTTNPNQLVVELDLSKLRSMLPAGTGTNQAAVVGGIDAAIIGHDVVPVQFQNLGNNTPDVLAADASQLTGEVGADASYAARSLFRPFMDSVVEHVMSEPSAGTGAWVSAFGGTDIGGANAGAGSHRFKATVAGVVAGFNWRPIPKLMVGGAVSAGTSSFRLTGDVGNGHASAYQAALYGHAQLSRHFYNSFVVAGALTSIKTERTLTVSGTDVLNAKRTATLFGGRYEAGVQTRFATVYAAGQDLFTSLPSVSEKAAENHGTFALHYASQSINSPSVELGLREDTDVQVTPRWILTPDFVMHLSAKLGWTHDFGSESAVDANFLALPSSEFSITGARKGKDAALFSAGAEFRFDGGLRIATRLNGAFSDKSQSFTGFADLGYQW